jgi:starch-binding outer membrane protein, SusD/RagB family
MRYIKYFLSMSLLVFITTACDDFLEKEPLGQESDKTFFNDAGNAVLAVNAIYDAISWDEGGVTGGGHNYEYIIGDIMTDDAAKGSTSGDFGTLKNYERWQAQATDFLIGATWANMYASVYRANQVIKNLPSSSIAESLKSRLLGEAYFLRAYAYFNLAIKVGGLPLVKEPVAISEWGKIPRASMGDTYKLIEADLTEAINRLPEKSMYEGSELGRATKGAAKAYLARAIMYQLGTDNSNAHTWQEVYDLTAEIMGSGQYALELNYARIFELEAENGPESIFEIQFVSNNIGGGPGKTGTTSTVFQGNRSTFGWGFNNPTVDLVNSFEAGDPRMPVTVYKDGDIVVGELNNIKSSDNETGYLNRKGFLEKGYRSSESKDSPKNIMKFRYADIILMRAEAAYYLGFESEAQSLVNTIRQRARTSTKPKGSTAVGSTSYEPYEDLDGVLPDISSTGAALLTDIWNERRHELAMESLRYYDLIRTGRYYDAMLQEDPTGASGDRAKARSIQGTGVSHTIPLLALPATESSSWNLPQNPGW